MGKIIKLIIISVEYFVNFKRVKLIDHYMRARYTTREMIRSLKNETINTWFDLGLFLDRIKEYNPVPTAEFNGSYEEYKEEIKNSGIAFITFGYSVDGVTIEIEKYAKVYRQNYENITVHYIGGDFKPESYKIIDERTRRFKIEEAKGFDEWKLYKDFFFTRLERGSKEYNALILKFWDEVMTITEKLGSYIEKNDIRQLFLVNVCSNPGNVSLALSTVLVSEYLGLPVISNNHDFYWEGGNKAADLKIKNIKPGPRDFFFTNSHLGEFFSQLEVLYPWESRSWLSVNINQKQTEHIIKENGHNVANTALLGTAVDTAEYTNTSKRKQINTFHQFEQILSRYKKTLVGYSVKDVIENKLVDEQNTRPILIGYKKTNRIKSFLAENLIFLQPTRIISRKRIEVGFSLLKKLINNNDFVEKLRETKQLKVTILVTGPIAIGHFNYFETLIDQFSDLLESLDEELREKIYVAFLFSELDKEKFKKKFKNPVGIPELYNIASLVLLPSETEGRGLPIIEAAACGTPIFCSRYFPEDVYSSVIGEHLPENDRLKVIEFDGSNITEEHVQKIFKRVFFPHRFIKEIKHNQLAVDKRYSLASLNENINTICHAQFMQLKSNEKSLELAGKALEKYKERTKFNSENLNYILKRNNRHYLPGYGRLGFMIYLKSLIDPSFFRVEEQRTRGYIFHFAKQIVENDPDRKYITEEKIIEFYNAADNIFRYKKGETNTRHDHSFSYRHRNMNYYPFQDFTIQEITGLVNMLFYEIIKPKQSNKIEKSAHFFTDWNLALSQMTSSPLLEIDDRKELLDRMHENKPIGIFSGKYVKYELEFFALQSVRSRFSLKIEEELTEELIKENKGKIEPVYLFVQEKPVRRWADSDEIIEYIEKGKDIELRLLYRSGILKVVKTKQWCVGIHFAQLGEEALKKLRIIKDKNGFIISLRANAAAMTDIVDIDRFHIGKVIDPLMAAIMGIKEGSGYIQFVPAGIRTSLAFPTPIQTAKDFSDEIKGKLFQDICNKLRKEKVYEEIRKDAEKNGSPLRFVLEKLSRKEEEKQNVPYSFVSGIYKDGLPWNGAIARINLQIRGKQWNFVTVFSRGKTKKVTEFLKEFAKTRKITPRIGWNGGYILNPELVGKLGLPETYIGSPLGLLVTDHKLISPPLFNKAAFLIDETGKLDIKRVNSSGGITISDEENTIFIGPSGYNCSNPDPGPAYYDLLHNEERITGDGRVIVRLAGNVIKEVIFSEKDETVHLIPVGLTLSFEKKDFPESFGNIEKELIIKINGLDNFKHAVEAGPLLVENGELNLDMKLEGWKTGNSIRTQAARLDYTDMRGPKIAVGIDNEGNLAVLTINGRIRESVGATHHDMADILKNFGMQKAMGFDPGGSSTLVVEGKTLNISPYNSNYEMNIYSLPPEPRAVSNAVLGYIE